MSALLWCSASEAFASKVSINLQTKESVRFKRIVCEHERVWTGEIGRDRGVVDKRGMKAAKEQGRAAPLPLWVKR